MDGLELRVRESGVNQRRQGPVVEEPLPVLQAVGQRVGGRRHVHRGGRRGPRRADPVLRPSKLPRRRGVAPHVGHEQLVRFADETERQRERSEPLDRVFERPDVVGDLLQIGRVPADSRAGLGGQQIAQARHRALDPARQHGLAADERAYQQIRVRQPPPLAPEAANREVRGGECGHDLTVPRDRRRERGGHERFMPARLPHQAPVGSPFWLVHRPCLRVRKRDPSLLAKASIFENNRQPAGAVDESVYRFVTGTRRAGEDGLAKGLDGADGW